ncbi:hypothetical protein L873DRAFT_1804507 [Choiromyces venosus 120613-1]|uniref:Uncharacterized protein n=1 Tax=Choiromyces venosus 120613-1 TaxID=1336337 RepID=A0A3N4JR19_9PEZI|nr:hypothetical protein L873DRAFT_1804507 [Choiromyces venosus 120613-1]
MGWEEGAGERAGVVLPIISYIFAFLNASSLRSAILVCFFFGEGQTNTWNNEC